MTSKCQKERAQKVIPGGTRKKESSVKSLNAIKKSKRKSTWNFYIFFEKWAGQVSGQVSGHVSRQEGFYAKLELFFGLRGDFPYCKRFVLAGTKREPSKQSLWEKKTNDRQQIQTATDHHPTQRDHVGSPH